MPVLCKLLEPGKGARRSTDCASHCRCGHPVVPQVPLVNNETQPVRFAPQYKTRYPFTDGWAGGTFSNRNYSPALGSEPVSSGL